MILSLSGKIGSGKDTCGDILVTEFGFTRMSFAESLKDVLSVIFSWNRDLLDGRTEESRKWREAVDPWWARRLGIPTLTPRWTLQNFATEVCRDNFHKDIWVASLEKRLLSLSENENVVVTDCRFKNELSAIKSVGAKAILITRDQSNNNVTHTSEIELLDAEYDFVIENNGTIAELGQKLRSII